MALDQHGTLLKMVVMVSQHHFTGRPCWSWLSWFICLSSRLWGQAHIGHAIFAVIRTHDMGISGIDATDGPVERLSADCEAHLVARMPLGTQRVGVALHVLPGRPQVAGEQTVRYVHLGALVRHDVGIRAPFPGHVACHRPMPIWKGDTFSNLHLLGSRKTSLCHQGFLRTRAPRGARRDPTRRFPVTSVKQPQRSWVHPSPIKDQSGYTRLPTPGHASSPAACAANGGTTAAVAPSTRHCPGRRYWQTHRPSYTRWCPRGPDSGGRKSPPAPSGSPECIRCCTRHSTPSRLRLAQTCGRSATPAPCPAPASRCPRGRSAPQQSASSLSRSRTATPALPMASGAGW